MAGMGKGTRITLLVLVILFLTAAVVRWAALASYDSRLQSELALLKADGGSDNVLDLLPKPLGNRDAGPITLLKADAFHHRGPRAWSGAAVNFTDPAVPEANKISCAYTQALSYPSAPGATWNEQWTPWLEKYLSENQVFIDRAKASVSGGPATFDTDWSKGYETLLPHLSNIREMARLLRVDAIVKAHKGDMAGAVDDIRTLLRLRRLVENDPILVSRLVAIAVDSITLSALSVVLDEGRIDRAGAEALLKELEGREERNVMTSAFLGETAQGLWTFARVRRNPSYVQTLGQMNAGGNPPAPAAESPLRKVGMHFVWLGFKVVWVWKADEYNYLREMRTLREASKKGFPAALKVSSPTAYGSNERVACSILTRMLTPAMSRAMIQQAALDARVRMARAALALSLYKADTGSYPPSLEALVPKYMPAVPVDPFDGKPIRYAPQATGYLMYSVYEDGADNGGVQYKDMPWRQHK